jgi:C1A family cysteine protease
MWRGRTSFTRWQWVVLAALAGLPAAGQLQDKDIQDLQGRGKREGWTFRVGHNEATKRHISELCNLREPSNWKVRARFVQPPALRSSKTTAAPDSATTAAPSPSSGTALGAMAVAGTLPSFFDWRTNTSLPPIRNQGSCGSCWAFATVGALECAIKAKDGVTADLSEQWLVSGNAEGWGCNGGWFAHDYHLKGAAAHDPYGDNGAVPESAFPYVAADISCNGPYPHTYWLDNWAYIGSESGVPTVDQIKSAIVNYGPVSAAIYVNSAFQAYGGGVFNVNDDKTINHAIVLVGWDDTQGTSGVWLLRNSWGTGWGESGYMRIEYGCCRVGYAASYVDYRSASAMQVNPSAGLSAIGPRGGPYAPGSAVYTLHNSATHAINWAGTHQQPWVTIMPGAGTLAAGGQVSVTVSLNSAASALSIGTYGDTVVFTNLTDHDFQAHPVTVRSGQRDYFTENFDTHVNDLDWKLLTFVPENSTNGYTAGCSTIDAFPTDPTGGTRLTLSDDGSSLIRLAGGLRIPFFGTTYTSFYACANGYLTFSRSDSTYLTSTTNHFKRIRIAALFEDLNPAVAGTVSWKQAGDHVAVTYQNIPEYNTITTNSFQIELFTNGVIRIAYLGLDTVRGLAGLSRGTGLPADFQPSDLSAYGADVTQNGRITLIANPYWGGTVTGGGLYPIGSVRSFSAAPALGWLFKGWNDGSLETNRSVNVSLGEVAYTASFQPTLAAALDATNLTWATGGDTNWFGQFATMRDGVAAAQSAPLLDGQQAWLETALTGPGSVLFWWQVSSAAGDYLEFLVDGQLKERIAGSVAWKQRAWYLGEGTHTLRWRYAKDTGGSAGLDTGWLDQVQWLPCPAATNAPQLFYQDAAGLLASWVLGRDGAFLFARLLANTDGWLLKSAGDVDGDGVADLLFQNAAGDIVGWFLNPDGSLRSAFSLGNTGAWEIRACADYLGAGRGQLFFQTPDGRVAYWQLDTNGFFQSSTYLGAAGGWRLRAGGWGGVASRADLYWQTASGLVAVWRQQPGGGMVAQLVASTGAWAMNGALDVDGDGVGDLVWQAPDGATAGWFMTTNAAPRDARYWWTTGGWKLKAAGR